MTPHLDIRHLLMLTEIDRTGSLTESAERLGVTPSALSHRLREAERRLDLVLFTRHGRRIAPTPACEALLRTAHGLLADLERAEGDAQRIGAGTREIVRLGLGAYSAYHWLPSFLAYLRQVDSAIQVEIVAGATKHPVAALLDGNIDVAIIAGRPTRPGTRTETLFTEELVAIMSPRHRLTGKRFIEPDDFGGGDYLTYSLTLEPGHEYDRALRNATTAPRRVIKVEQIEAIVEMVKADLGLSILARWAMEPHVRSGALVCRPVTESGLDMAWTASVRANDAADGAPAVVVRALGDWCVDTGTGLRTMTEDSA